MSDLVSVCFKETFYLDCSQRRNKTNQEKRVQIRLIIVYLDNDMLELFIILLEQDFQQTIEQN